MLLKLKQHQHQLIFCLLLFVFIFSGLVIKNFIQLAFAQSSSEWTLLTDGFESGDFLSPTNSNDWTRSTSGCTGTCIQVSSTNTHTGTYSLEAIGQGSNYAQIYKHDLAGGDLDQVKLEFWLDIDAPTISTNVGVASMTDSADGSLAMLRVTSDKKIYISGDSSENQYTISGWNKIAFEFTAGSPGTIKLWINDTLMREFSVDKPNGASYIKLGKVSSGSTTGSFFYDDVNIIMPSISDLWVDQSTGSDSNNGLTEGAAFATIQKAANLAGPGSTVHINSGVYTEQVEPLFKGLNPDNETITFQGEAGETVYIDGDANDDGTRELPSSLWNGLFSLDGVDHVKISNITIRQSNWAGIFANDVEDLEITNVTTLNTNSSGIYIYTAADVSVHDNTVRAGCEHGEDAGNLPQENISIVHVHDFVVYDNHVYDGVGLIYGGEGIDIKGNSYRGNIYGNHVYDMPGDVGIYVGVTSSGSLSNPEQGAYDLNIYNNEVSADKGISVSAESGGHVQDVKIFNNLVYSGAYGGILVTRWNGIDVTGTKRNIDIFNNIVYKQSQDGIVGIGVQCYNEGEVADINIWNNIVSQNGYSQIDVQSCAANVSVENNLIDGYLGNTDEIDPDDAVNCPNCLSGDPSFTDPDASTPDFHLLAGSGGIDSGKAVYVDLDFDGNEELLDFDFDNNTRPINSLFDLGAYEYQTSSYTVTFTAGANGTLTGTTSQSVLSGNDASAVTAVANTGYHLLNWTGTGFTTSTSNPLTVTNVTQDLNITANFAINTHTITASSSGDGTITPSGIITYNYGASQNFVFTPEENQSIRTLYIDGTSVDVASNYTFDNITSNHTIAVTFSSQTLSAGFTSNLTQINENEAIQFIDTSATPDDRTITSWLWDFGDGNTSDQSSPTHTYTNAGTYTVKLTITDDQGNTSTKEIINLITVERGDNSSTPAPTPEPTPEPTSEPTPTPTPNTLPPGKAKDKKIPPGLASDVKGTAVAALEDLKVQATTTFNKFGAFSWIWLGSVVGLSIWSLIILLEKTPTTGHHKFLNFH